MADLHPAESQLRQEHAAHLEGRANVDGLEAEIARAIHDKAAKIRNAMPILDFGRAMQAHEDSLNHGPSSGLDGIDYRAGVREAQAKLRENHIYPPELEMAVGAALLRGISWDDIDLYQVCGIPDPAVEKAVRVRKARTYKPGAVSRKDGWCAFCGVETTIAESENPPHKTGRCETSVSKRRAEILAYATAEVRKALAKVDADVSRMNAELAELKAGQTELGARF